MAFFILLVQPYAPYKWMHFILEILEFVVVGTSCFVKMGVTVIDHGILHFISTALWLPN